MAPQPSVLITGYLHARFRLMRVSLINRYSLDALKAGLGITLREHTGMKASLPWLFPLSASGSLA
jgi:hypothetical protein